jgi:hypothetical protein
LRGHFCPRIAAYCPHSALASQVLVQFCRMWEDRAKGGLEREKKVVVLRELCRAVIYSTKMEIM